MTDPGRQLNAPSAGQLTGEHLDLALGRLAGLGTLPGVASRLLALTAPGAAVRAEDNPVYRESVAIVRGDPALTAKLLSLAGPPAATAADAVRRLGLPGVHAAALSVGVLEASDETGALDCPALWRHCLAVAAAAELLAPHARREIAPERAFLCGLLHDLGKLALAQCLPKSYRRVLSAVAKQNGDIADYERDVLGFDHAVAGRRLAILWRLPACVVEVLWLHHQPLEAIPPSIANRELIGLVALADALARDLRVGFSGNCTFDRTPEQLAGALGIEGDVLGEVAERLPERIEALAGPLGLDDATGPALHREALAGANAELVRANEQLRRRAEALRCQADAFGRLRDFSAALTPEATVADSLTRLAAAMAEPPGTEGADPPSYAYCFGTEERTVMAVRCGGSGPPSWRVLAQHAPADRTRPPEAALGPVEVLALLGVDEADLADWPELQGCRHRPLLCAGEWVGGLFQPGGANEAPVEDEAVGEALAAALAMALAIVQQRARAVRLSEEFAEASQLLARGQETLAEAKTLEAVGEMAAGAAHELNNPLAVVSGRAQLMSRRATTEEDKRTWDLMAEQAHRISDIISDLMDFANPPEPRRSSVALGDLCQAAWEDFRANHSQAGTAGVDISVDDGAPAVWVDRAQLQAVLVELLSNAAHAATDRPVIRIRAEAHENGESALLSVADNGPGMDEQTRSRACTPFFSVQRAGRRRGLGLPRARRYVERNGGRMWIRSRPEEGTTVFVSLPAAREAENGAR